MISLLNKPTFDLKHLSLFQLVHESEREGKDIVHLPSDPNIN